MQGYYIILLIHTTKLFLGFLKKDTWKYGCSAANFLDLLLE